MLLMKKDAFSYNKYGIHRIQKSLFLPIIAKRKEVGRAFDIELLADRFLAIALWLKQHSETKEPPLGFFGSSTGVAAALEATTRSPDKIAAVYLALDGRVVSLIGISDPIKESTSEAIRNLHDEGITVVMLTGDSRRTAETVASKLGIGRVQAEVLPDQKVNAVKQFQDEGKIVAMAGDGINDAPALAQAQVGIAMGTGTDVAMESAGVTLVRWDLRGIVRARRLSRATMRNIRHNLFFAIIYNSIGLPIAADVFYPFFGLLLSPIIAALAMSFSLVSVITKSLRLRRISL